MMDDQIHRPRQAFDKHCRLTTTPVAVKLADEGEAPPKKVRYPVAQVGHPLALVVATTLQLASPDSIHRICQ